MSYTTNETRGGCSERAELWLHGSKLADVEVSLTDYVKVVHVNASGGQFDTDDTVSWNGDLVDGLSEHEQNKLLGKKLELHLLRTGKIGRVALANNKGSLKGIGWPPFPIEYNGKSVNDKSEITR
ncbi:MAG: hypothetical protein ACYDEY_03280 [Acidimicrobiales bacterium]